MRKDAAQSVLAELLAKQAEFVLPFRQVADSLLASPARSVASNQVTVLVASAMYDVINKKVYAVDTKPLQGLLESGMVLGSR